MKKIVAVCTYPADDGTCGHGFEHLWDKQELAVHMRDAHSLVWFENPYNMFEFGWRNI